MKWRIIESNQKSPQEIMDIDTRLLEELTENSQPILHLYEWNTPCLTHGYFTNPHKHLHKNKLEEHQLCIARRPTGGGIIFHLSDFAFSILIPSGHPNYSTNTLENYKIIHQLIAIALSPLLPASKDIELLSHASACSTQECASFCMSKPTQYDLIISGKKIGGAAQRKKKSGFLHQGSISIAMPPLSILKDVLIEPSIVKAMQENSYSFLGLQWTQDELENMRSEIKELLKNIINNI